MTQVMAAALFTEFGKQVFVLSDGKHQSTPTELKADDWKRKLGNFFRNWRIGQYTDCAFPNHPHWNAILTLFVRDDSKAKDALNRIPRVEPNDCVDQVTHARTYACCLVLTPTLFM